jgi:kojibiose phosphorylase
MNQPSKRPEAKIAWTVSRGEFALARERELESIFTVANGYVGTRGSVPELTSSSAPATFLAGVFEPGEAPGSVVELVKCPNWTRLDILVEGLPLSLEEGKVLEHRRSLDLRQGVLTRYWRHKDPEGRITRLEFTRLVSIHDRHLFAQCVTVSPENYSGSITLESVLEMPTALGGWQTGIDRDLVCLEKRTARGIVIAMALSSRMAVENGAKSPDRSLLMHECVPVDRWVWQAAQGDLARHERTVLLSTSREEQDPVDASRRRVRMATDEGFGWHFRRHAAAWDDRWRAAGLQIDGDEAAQQALRFALYHLYSSVNPADERVSVGARGLTGSSYKGHVFWDTEIYVLPVFTFTYPAAARSLLMYRYHTLPAARARARKLGYEGALYAWESADSGEDVTPETVIAPGGEVVKVLTGLQEHHISADIAYAVWQYWQATADETFLAEAGAEILIETARFWATRGKVEADGRYHIRTVIGPDEYHENVDDNAFTNVMAAYNLERAAEAAEWLQAKHTKKWRTLSKQLHIGPDEPAGWRRTALDMATGFDPATGLFEQFTGYFQLEDLDLNAYRQRTVPMDVILGHEKIQRTKVVKQADVVALSALLWDRFPRAVHEANFRYYEPRTGHGSSLSPALHALVSARLGDADMSLRYLEKAAAVDLSNHMGNGAGGVHVATLGGMWQAAVFGMGGVRMKEDRLVIDPHLPPQWRELAFSIQWRGRALNVVVGRSPAQIHVRLEAGEPMTIEIGEGLLIPIERNRPGLVRMTEAGWSPRDN